MHKRNRWFITSALIYALLGGLVALVRLALPDLLPGNVPRIHAHMMLLGFMLQFIYGIALHVLPRFSGYPLYSERMANWQLYGANVGLPLMLAGWFSWTEWLVRLGGVVSYAAIVMFAVNILLTVKARAPGR